MEEGEAFRVLTQLKQVETIAIGTSIREMKPAHVDGSGSLEFI